MNIQKRRKPFEIILRNKTVIHIRLSDRFYKNVVSYKPCLDNYKHTQTKISQIGLAVSK